MINGLYVAQNALQATQAALSITSNNLANMNTEGYSKQRADLVAMVANNNSSNLTIQARNGMGCDIGSITRYRDSFLDSVYRENSSNYSYYEEMSGAALVLENFSNGKKSWIL